MNKKLFIFGLVFVSIFSEKLLGASGSGEIEKIKEMICSSDEKLMSSLLEEGMNVHSLLEGNVGLLEFAITTGADIALIKSLIEQGININHADDNGSTPINIAVLATTINPKRYSYYLEVVKLLLENGVQVNPQLKKHGGTPLILLCANLCGNEASNDLEQLMTLLLEAGADTNIQDNEYHFTALHCAILRKASLNIINLLLKFGANPDIECKFPAVPGGAPSLHLAIRQDLDPSIIEALLKAKANPNKLNSGGLTPLNIVIGEEAVRKKRHNNSPNGLAVMKLLIKYGANPKYNHPVYGSIRKLAEELLGKDHPMTVLLQ